MDVHVHVYVSSENVNQRNVGCDLFKSITLEHVPVGCIMRQMQIIPQVQDSILGFPYQHDLTIGYSLWVDKEKLNIEETSIKNVDVCLY